MISLSLARTMAVTLSRAVGDVMGKCYQSKKEIWGWGFRSHEASGNGWPDLALWKRPDRLATESLQEQDRT